MRLRHAAALFALALAAVPSAATAQGLPAQVVDVEFPSRLHSYPVVDHGPTDDPGDDRSGSVQWRVIDFTGNCCEQHLTATRDGRLLDFGGSYINYSDDRGLTWKSVRPQTPLVNGEGSIVIGPGGDVLGVEWDPYSGDHLLSFRFDAAEQAWTYGEMPLKTPFYDREWIAVVPGPLTINGETVEWASFVKGGSATKEPWFYSTDGIVYTGVSSMSADFERTEAVEGPLPVAANADFDWIGPTTNAGLAPLGAGRALAAPVEASDWGLLAGDTFQWSAFRLPGAVRPEGRFLVDSGGRVHNVIAASEQFTYRMSVDGGRTWTSLPVPHPGHAIEEIDFRANRAVGVAAVAIHAHNTSTNKDQDLLYKLDIAGDSPRLTRSYRLGLGDVDAGAGLGQSIRVDFVTVAILPDGRLAATVIDSTTTSHSLTMGDGTGPSLAIEGDATLPPGPAPPAPPAAPPQAAPPPAAHRVTLRVRRRGRRLVATGTVLPRHAGHVVLVQRRRGTRWATLARLRLPARSTFRATHTIRRFGRSERFRAIALPDSAGHRRGTSRTVRLLQRR